MRELEYTHLRELEYIHVTNLTKIRTMTRLLGDILPGDEYGAKPEEVRRVAHILSQWEARLAKLVSTDEDA